MFEPKESQLQQPINRLWTMAVAALCWVSTADAQSAGTTQAQGSFSRPATKRSGDCINFNRLPAGQIPSQVFGRRGTGPVFLLGVNPTLGGNPNAAVIFDSTNPTGTDIDLGTPNEDFGGPGVGDGGESGSPFQNDADLGRLLIVGEDLVDLNNDDLVDDPDDADVVDARLEFDFSSVGPVVIDSITQVDTETDREIPLVEFFDDTNSLITTRRLQQPGNNGVATTEIVGVYNVTRMVINLFGSGAIDNVCFTEMVDCNDNGIPDDIDIDTGTSDDCNNNGVPDECEDDCDNDGIPDTCEDDCDNDGTPDDCEPDCDNDGTPDDCEDDCDNDGTPDDCEPDCDSDGIPDDCEPDCDNDGLPDDCEPDCDSDGTPDDCEDDCDNDGTPDDCEPDCDNDGTPDDCETGPDCNSNGIPDECELDGNDCDSNGIPDECDLDCDNDGTPDDCEPDCDSDGTPDDCEPDCDSDGTPDDCEPDCDSDGIPDDCETDTDGNGIPDECEDCDDDGIPDGDEPDCDDDGIPDDCEDDCNANGVPDDCEGCLETLNIVWDANDCLAFSDASFFHEFTGQVVGGCSNLGVYPTNLDEPNGMHSCTDDAITGDPGDAFCVAADSDSSYDLDDDDDRVMFSVTLDETAGSTATLTDFSFWHKAPFTAITSDEGGQNGSEENDPPEFYGVRIFRDGAEVFFMQDIPTSPDWVETVFDFSGDANFMVSSDTVVFDFELMGYAPINDNGGPQIWDLDEFNVSVCCSEGGSSNDCDGDGTPDFCELDCNENGIPDDCDIIDGTSWDDDNNGIPDECECAPAAWPTEEGSWDLSGEMWAVFSFGSDNYWIDCMTVTHDGNGNLHVVGEATGSSGTLSIDFTYTCSFSGSDLVSSNPDNDTGSMTHVGTGETIPLEGKSNGSYSGALISTGAFTAEFSGWLSNANTGQLVGDWDPHVDADATCTPCN